MKVIAKVYIKHNGTRYSPDDTFEIDEKDYKSLKEIVEEVDGDGYEDETEDEVSEGHLQEDGSLEDKADKEDEDSVVKDEKDEKDYVTLDLSTLSISKLRVIAKDRGIKGYSTMEKEELLEVL